MWHKQSFTQFWSQSDAYSRRSSLKLTYIHHPLVVCTHQICCAVAVPIALSQDRLLHGHNRLVNWTPCSRVRESKLKSEYYSARYQHLLAFWFSGYSRNGYQRYSPHGLEAHWMSEVACMQMSSRSATKWTSFWGSQVTLRCRSDNCM